MKVKEKISYIRYLLPISFFLTNTTLIKSNAEFKASERVTISQMSLKKDKTAPELNISFDEKPSNSYGSIQINATDTQSGVKRIKLPNGNYINSDMAEFITTSNGSYTFVAEDVAGNTTTRTVQLTNIDTTAPTITYNLTYDTNNTVATLTVYVTDTGLGVKEVNDWENKYTNKTSFSYRILVNGQYLISAEDLAGNISTCAINIDKLNNPVSSGINKLQYKLSGATTSDWRDYTNQFVISNEGTTTVTARSIDNAGNISNELQVPVNIDKTKPNSNSIVIRLL